MAQEVAAAKALGIEVPQFAHHLSSGHIQFINDHFRFQKELLGIDKGTLYFPQTNEVVFGFPKIRRILAMRNLGMHFKKPFYVEEKLDGYNVRLCKVNNEVLAFTRGGIKDKYTAQRILQHMTGDFFDKHPQYVLCGEVIGLQNPYQEKGYPEERDFGFYVFDVREKNTNKPVSAEKRYALMKRFKINQVRSFGLYKATDWQALLKLTRKLGDQGREGIVMKSHDIGMQLKYTSNQSTSKDLEYAFTFPFDYGQAFFFRRLIRQGFQASELNLTKKQLDHEAARIGKAILFPMVHTINELKKGNEVTEDFEIEVPDEQFGREFIEHLKKMGLVLSVRGLKKGRASCKFRISRHYQATNDKTKAYLQGSLSSD